ncbi:J domain-containing protein [Enhygromyxa salina]|uniref:Chaperone protein DnaJ n=1 Tax=Enhygromyxa salina TaxID=215803 RepID=A0A2S9YDJ6_9BACT|nr:J domain-containing protein [Enhygromyxa salina]PRQ03190.1 Chaperone protein DnaJ [Enhygromyxa salina]
MRDPDYYEILGLGPEAETDEILRAFHRALEHDRSSGTGRTPARTRLIEEAFAVLIDPTKRAEYDARCVGEDLIDETAAAISKVSPPISDQRVEQLETHERELLETLRQQAAAARRARGKS